MSNRIRSLLNRFRRCREGVAAVEFALTAPILSIVLMGTIELSNYMTVVRKVDTAAHTAANLIAQETDLSTAELSTLFQASRHVVHPLDDTLLTLGASSVRFDDTDGTPFEDWSGDYNSGDVANPTTAATGMGAAGESVIIVSASFAYTPAFNMVLKGPFTVTETAIARPRYINYVGLF